MKESMKSDVRYKQLSEICTIVNGGTPDTKVSQYWNGNILWITPKDMGKLTSPYVFDTERKLSPLGLSKSSAKLLPIDSIVLSSRAPIGHLAINKSELATNQGCKGLIPNSLVDVKYLYYFLLFSKELLNDLGSGTTFKELSSTKLSTVLVPLFSVEEQKRIVSILDDVFKDADRSQEIAEKNLNNLERLFNSYVLGLIVDDSYKKYSLTDVCEDIFAGGDVPKNRWTKKLTDEYTVPIYTNGEKDNGLYGYTDRARVLKPSITVSARGTIGYTQIRNEGFYPAIRLIVLIPNLELVEIKYLQYIVRNLNIKYSGSSIPQLTVPMVKNYSVTLPPLTSQRNIIENIEALEEERSLLEKVLRNIKQKNKDLKKSVLNKAFGGEL